MFDRKNNNSGDEAESLTEIKKTQYTLPLGFSPVNFDIVYFSPFLMKPSN